MSHLKNNSGQSLLLLLPLIGVISIIIAGLASVFDYQSRATEAMAQRVAALEAARLLNGLLKDATLCSAIVTRQTLSLNSTALGASSVQFDLGKVIPLDSRPNAPAAISVGAPVSGSSKTLKVEKISLKNISGPGVGGTYSSDLEVSFAKDTMVRPPKPIQIKLRLQTSSAGGQTITGCQSFVASTGPCSQMPSVKCGTGCKAGSLCSCVCTSSGWTTVDFLSASL